MAFELKDNSGALFKNDQKKTDNHPDYTGKVKVNGREMRIAAWLKASKGGKGFMSLSFSEPQVISNSNEGNLDGIPF